MTGTILVESNIPGLPEPIRGKVRDVYDLGDKLLIVSTDRVSAFDVIMENGIPDKGCILNKISEFWFHKLAHICPHHLISIEDEEIKKAVTHWSEELSGRCLLAQKATPLTTECVARGYITGSLYKEYQSQGGAIHGLQLAEGLLDGSQLEEAIFTPATKATSGHDENISLDEMVKREGEEIAEKAKFLTLKLYEAARDLVAEHQLILADTKFEFGLIEGELVWIDEALSPDSSRYWEASTWKPGQQQPCFDKQFIRDYLEGLDWDKTHPGPTLPPEIVEKARAKYIEAFERITGQTYSVS